MGIYPAQVEFTNNWISVCSKCVQVSWILKDLETFETKLKNKVEINKINIIQFITDWNKMTNLIFLKYQLKTFYGKNWSNIHHVRKKWIHSLILAKTIHFLIFLCYNIACYIWRNDSLSKKIQPLKMLWCIAEIGNSWSWFLLMIPFNKQYKALLNIFIQILYYQMNIEHIKYNNFHAWYANYQTELYIVRVSKKVV